MIENSICAIIYEKWIKLTIRWVNCLQNGNTISPQSKKVNQMRWNLYYIFVRERCTEAGEAAEAACGGTVGSGLTPGSRLDGHTPEILVLSGARAGKLKMAQWFIIEFCAV